MESESESRSAIIAAVVGNLAIATIKFIASVITGSAAMMSEGVHSMVDTGNGLLMLYGVYKSHKPPDEKHPFGHGSELYFWSLIVAISIFAVGGGMSVYEGVLHLITPSRVENAVWNYSVLGISAIFESISWYFGWKAFQVNRRGKPIIEAIHVSKDPTSFTVLLEDSTALIGLAIAFLGIFFGQVFDIPYFDGIASILIGGLLGLAAWFLAFETKGLLIGEAVDPDVLDEIRKLAESDRGVNKVLKALTLYFGPTNVLLTLEIEYIEDISAVDLRSAIRRIERTVKEEYPFINWVFFEAQSLSEEEIEAQHLDV